MPDILIGFIWGICITIFLIARFFEVSRKHPYRWGCPECNFFISTNKDPDFVLGMAELHERSHKESEI